MKTKVVDLSTPCGVRILQGAPRRGKGKTSRHEVSTKSIPLFPLRAVEILLFYFFVDTACKFAGFFMFDDTSSQMSFTRVVIKHKATQSVVVSTKNGKEDYELYVGGYLSTAATGRICGGKR